MTIFLFTFPPGLCNFLVHVNLGDQIIIQAGGVRSSPWQPLQADLVTCLQEAK